ncbi:hypothetical protein QCW_1729 [Clostridioides difficile CD69]|nr:hypothetical protein QCW_1729 [Clostridioides difficile CD69]
MRMLSYNYRSVCFILTMWYVNMPTYCLNEKNYCAFYINYVVCKSLLGIALIASVTCFILTMWYVNLEKT